MASITFTDTTGAATLQSAWPSSINRFNSWVPFSRPIGEGANRLSNGQRHQFRFRTDYGASFEIRGIANTDVDIALRLQEHLLGDGNTCTVTTGDASSRVYTTCALAPGTEPELSGPDPETLEYTLSLTVIDVATTPTPMLCEYP
jgi:hypothetical protein